MKELEVKIMSETFQNFPEYIDWADLTQDVSQELRRLTQAWLKVVGRHKYRDFIREDNLGFLRWCARKSELEFRSTLERLTPDWKLEPRYVMVQNAIRKAIKEQEKSRK